MVSDAGPTPVPPGDDASVTGMTPTPTAALTQVLVGIYSNAAQMSAFVRSFSGLKVMATSLPADSVSADEMAFALACRLQEHNLVNREFFLALVRVRPFQTAQIKQAANICGIELTLRPDAATPWSSSPKLLAASSGLLVLVVVAGGLMLGAHDDPSTPPAQGPGEKAVAEKLGAGVTKPPAPAPIDKRDISMIPDKILVEEPQPPPVVPAPEIVNHVPPLDNDIISLGQDEKDPVILTVVSPATGKTRLVSLSRHRSTDSAAKAIFVALKLKNDPDIARALSYDEYALCQAEKCYTTESVGAVIDVTVPVSYKRRLTAWTPDKTWEALIKVTTPTGTMRASDPFVFPGDYKELFMEGDPWAMSLHIALLAGEYPKLSGDQELTYSFGLSVCPDGTIKPAKRRGTGRSKVDAEIAVELAKITLSDTRAIKPLLKGKCKKLLHTFSMKLSRSRASIK